MLNNSDFLRYSSQLLLKEIGYKGQFKLQKSSVLIIGLGGLGTPVSLYLTAAGVGNILLVDYDIVSLNNLQRQIIYNYKDIGKLKVLSAKSFLKKINSQIKINISKKYINNKTINNFVKKVNLVLDCTDNIITRQIINASCVKLNRPLISASAIGFNGQLMVITPPWDYGCYHCLWPDSNNDYENNLTCQTTGVLGPIVGVIGSLQALEAIKLIINNYSLKNYGKLILFNGYYNNWYTCQLQADKNCIICKKN